MLKTWFYQVSFGICGCNDTGTLEAPTEAEALDVARELAIDNAEMYGYYQDKDFFGDLDQVGNSYLEDDNEYEQIGTLDYYVEPYNPEKHDQLI